MRRRDVRTRCRDNSCIVCRSAEPAGKSPTSWSASAVDSASPWPLAVFSRRVLRSEPARSDGDRGGGVGLDALGWCGGHRARATGRPCRSGERVARGLTPAVFRDPRRPARGRDTARFWPAVRCRCARAQRPGLASTQRHPSGPLARARPVGATFARRSADPGTGSHRRTLILPARIQHHRTGRNGHTLVLIHGLGLIGSL